MMKIVFKFAQWCSLLILTLALLFGWQQFSPAQILSQSTGQLEARLSQLQSETVTLRSRVSRLESNVARLSRNTGTTSQPEPVEPRPLPTDGSAGSALAG
ncbi:MAG: hypothetical protein HC772_06890 [Leptolyngbyaceae cyanobacterium CRU_2_3]|nr:hypothetical protein [Leptolyngbyaceae cyanobacterium CRU_2_3]